MKSETSVPRSDSFLESITFALALTVVCRLVAFGRGMVLVRTLDATDLGTWALVANAVQVLAFLLALGVPSGLSRYVERCRGTGRLPEFLRKTSLHTLSWATVACLLGLVCWYPLGKILFGPAANWELVLVTVLAVMGTVWFSLLQGTLHGLRFFRANSLLELCQNIGFLLLLILFVLVWRDDVFSAACAHLVITLLVTAVAVAWVARFVRDQPTAEAGDVHPADLRASKKRLAIGTLIAYSLGTWSAGSLQAAWRGIDRYMLLHLGGMDSAETLDQIGQYFIASKLGQPLTAFAGVLAVVLVPHAARLWENGSRREAGELIRLLAKVSVLAMMVGGAILMLFQEWLFVLLAGCKPPYATLVFAPVLITIIAVSFQYVVRAYLLCRERAWSITGVWALTLVANIGLNVALIPSYQLMGAAVATMISAAFAAILVLLISMRHGLRVDFGLWLMVTLPGLLLCPPVLMLSLLACVAALAVGSERVFDRQEKDQIRTWCLAQIEKLFHRRRSSEFAAS